MGNVKRMLLVVGLVAGRMFAAEAGPDLEKKFDVLLDVRNPERWMEHLTSRVHHLSSPGSKENAEYIAAQFRSWGYSTVIERFDVLFPSPLERRVELLAPTSWKAALTEPPVHGDRSSQNREHLAAYNAYSVDGDVTGELVYVNYGLPKDYDELALRGVDVRGKIVIARYGASWRGIKPKVAAEKGAIGCIIYSDPRDDGFFRGDVYPRGSWRNEQGVQRGSVMDSPIHTGDPLTPGWGSIEGAKRLSFKDVATFTKIPVLPISYGDARPLLEALGGPVAPEDWRGALALTYHLGPGPAKVRVAVKSDWKTVPLYNVIATMKGEDRPDEWIIRGNHHDAWVFGADDPVSGLVAMMEEARVIAELTRTGWRPSRTIVYAAWDGEEEGLLGSTEWAETHADELKGKAAVYINSDNNGRGFLYAGGSHTLEKLLSAVARDVVDPQRNVSVFERARAIAIVEGEPDQRREARDRGDLRLAALGSGSDFTPFLQHLGIASLHIGFGGEDGGGSYHSIYDSFEHYKRFGDPGLAYNGALSRLGGRLVLRLAGTSLLPFDTRGLADNLQYFLDDLVRSTDTMRKETEEHNRQVEEGTMVLAADPTKTFVAPPAWSGVPYFDFARMRNSVARLKESATRFEKERNAREAALARPVLDDLNRRFIALERTLTLGEGLPGRPWYRHQVYAPGQYTGYGVKTFPSVREAIELRKWAEAEEQIRVVSGAIDAASAAIEAALVSMKTPVE